ncbi:hypothetical protein JOF29_006810 [Kribbella aluminosa]|uniref:Transglycosylase SLT domain-containing protein n=1 Tax=Kribbella aluminosa TaxID=416017 RepID=A0ABS4UVP0_9ACTN|nr:lytic transglycosylase domain-containing protein [Kribbella aluminosa]MBP2355700.1 hypothetical protein [Kribbella aluminosa]
MGVRMQFLEDPRGGDRIWRLLSGNNRPLAMGRGDRRSPLDVLAAVRHLAREAEPTLRRAADGRWRWELTTDDGRCRGTNPSREDCWVQFIPGTWATFGADGNGDGIRDPHNVFDAARATGDYLCQVGADLSNPQQLVQAVLRYNHSMDYVSMVLRWMQSCSRQTVAIPDSHDHIPDAGNTGNTHTTDDKSHRTTPPPPPGITPTPSPTAVPTAPPSAIIPTPTQHPVRPTTPTSTRPPYIPPPTTHPTPPPPTTLENTPTPTPDPTTPPDTPTPETTPSITPPDTSTSTTP